MRRCKRTRTQLAHADPTHFAGDDYLALFEHADMLHEAGQGHVVALCKIANAGRAVRKLRYDGTAGAMRQGMKDAIKVSHMAN